MHGFIVGYRSAEHQRDRLRRLCRPTFAKERKQLFSADMKATWRASSLAVTLFLAFFVSSQATDVDFQNRVDALAEAAIGISAANARYAAAIDRGDGEAIYDLYERDAIVVSPDRSVVRGNAVIAGIMNEAFKKGVTMRARLVTEKVDRSGDFATEAGTYTLTASPPKDKPVVNTGTYLALWRRHDSGSWKWVWQIWVK